MAFWKFELWRWLKRNGKTGAVSPMVRTAIDSLAPRKNAESPIVEKLVSQIRTNGGMTQAVKMEMWRMLTSDGINVVLDQIDDESRAKYFQLCGISPPKRKVTPSQ